MRIAVFLSFALVLLFFGVLSIFSVPEDSEALVLRGTEVKRKVGPGLQAHAPFFENVVIEPVLRERLFRYDTPFEIQGCQADVSLIYRIGDLEAYHAFGRDLRALMDKRHAVEGLLDTLPDLPSFAESDKPYARQISEHMKPLAGPVADGLYINRIDVSLEDGCEPKRIVRETPLPSLVSRQVDAFAPERVAPGNLRVTTSDGMEILIEGFVATYQIEDTSRAASCFGQNSTIIATRIGHLAEVAIGRAVEKLTLAQLAELPTKLPGELNENDMSQCGLSLGAVDFNEATFARRLVINCEETPTEDCSPKPFVIPGLTVQD